MPGRTRGLKTLPRRPVNRRRPELASGGPQHGNPPILDAGTEQGMPEILYILIDYPLLILLPIVVLAALSLWSGSRTAWVVTVLWLLYLGYEFGIKYQILCTDCVRRPEMYVVYPLLALATAVAAVQVYVHVRRRSPR
jgi:hypothetical protein